MKSFERPSLRIQAYKTKTLPKVLTDRLWYFYTLLSFRNKMGMA